MPIRISFIVIVVVVLMLTLLLSLVFFLILSLLLILTPKTLIIANIAEIGVTLLCLCLPATH